MTGLRSLILPASAWDRASYTEQWSYAALGFKDRDPIRRAQPKSARRDSVLLQGGSMKSILAFGILLLVLGVVGLVYQSISYTKQENIAQLGPVRVTKEESKTIDLPPVLGVTAVGVGAILVVAAVRKR